MTKGGDDSEDGGGTKAGGIQSRRRLLNLVVLQLLVGVPRGIRLSFDCVRLPRLLREIGKMMGQLVVDPFLQLILWPRGTRSGRLDFADEQWGFVARWRSSHHIMGHGVPKGVILEPNGGEVG